MDPAGTPPTLQAPAFEAGTAVNGREGGPTRVRLAAPLAVLREVCARGGTGQLVFYTPAGSANVWLRGGTVVDASLGRLDGERTLLHLLSYGSSRWRELPRAEPERQTLHTSLPDLEDKVRARQRQWSELLGRLPPLSAVLEPQSVRDHRSGAALEGVRGSVYALIDGHRPLFAVLDESGLDPVAALSSVMQLLDGGAVTWSGATATSLDALEVEGSSEAGLDALEAFEEPAPSDPVRLLAHRPVHDVTPSEPTAPPRPEAGAVEEPTPPSSRPRPIVGRYEILGRLGRGGMATVYACRLRGEGGFSRQFAMKVLREHLCRSPEAVQLLLREARLTGRLHHPNVVSVVDVGSNLGQPYLVMEYVAGCSVADLLLAESRGVLRIEAPVAAAIGVEALAGLHAAHTLGDEHGRLLGLVHQDVSPENLLVGFDGVTRVTDFGVAHVNDVLANGGQERGKPQYLAPERISSGEVDHRADIFAMGVVLYRLLTGLNLFEGDDPEEVMQRVLYEPIPPPSTVGRRPHPAFDPVCLRALERDRARRYQSAEHFRAELLRNAVLVEQLAVPSEVAEASRRAAESLRPAASAREAEASPRGSGTRDDDPVARAGVRAIVLARSPRPRSSSQTVEQETRVLPAPASKPPPTWAVAVFLVVILGLALALDAFSDSTPAPLPVPAGDRGEPADDSIDAPEIRIRIDEEDEDPFAPLREELEPTRGLELPREAPPVTPTESTD